MKTIKNALRWLLVNGVFASCLYFWKIEGVGNAGNVAMFYIWLGLIIGLLTVGVDVTKVKSYEIKSKLFYSIDGMFDWTCIGFLVWFGHVGLGVAYLIHYICGIILIDKVKKHREKEAEQ